MYLFNNCHNRRHADIYGSGAFFDLDTAGPQDTVAGRVANELAVEETCIVASLDITGDVTFDWYEFSREIVRPDEAGKPCHAYFGKHFKTETLSRDKAKRNAIYSFFLTSMGTSNDHRLCACNFSSGLQPNTRHAPDALSQCLS